MVVDLSKMDPDRVVVPGDGTVGKGKANFEKNVSVGGSSVKSGGVGVLNVVEDSGGAGKVAEVGVVVDGNGVIVG